MKRISGLGPGPWAPGPLGLLIAMEIFHDVNLGFGPGPWVPGPLGLLIAMEIFHDVNLGFGPKSLNPKPSRVTHRHGSIP